MENSYPQAYPHKEALVSKESHAQRVPAALTHEVKIYRYPGTPYVIVSPTSRVFVPMLSAKFNNHPMFAMPEDGPVFTTLDLAEGFLKQKLAESQAAERVVPLYVPDHIRRRN